jgi:hypothetical protein
MTGSSRGLRVEGTASRAFLAVPGSKGPRSATWTFRRLATSHLSLTVRIRNPGKALLAHRRIAGSPDGLHTVRDFPLCKVPTPVGFSPLGDGGKCARVFPETSFGQATDRIRLEPLDTTRWSPVAAWSELARGYPRVVNGAPFSECRQLGVPWEREHVSCVPMARYLLCRLRCGTVRPPRGRRLDGRIGSRAPARFGRRTETAHASSPGVVAVCSSCRCVGSPT